MAKRPALSQDSFLKHLFAPKKNPLPTGIRKRDIAYTKGRVKGRVAAYNRMSGQSQEILRRSGLRDAYLKGDVTLASAKKILRETAVTLGIAKPLRARPPKPAPAGRRETLDGLVAMHVARTLVQSGHPVSKKIYGRVPFLPIEKKREVLSWDANRIRAYASQTDPEYMAVDDGGDFIIIDGHPFNPLWYR